MSHNNKVKLVIARINTGNNQQFRIPIVTSADLAHLFALALGYNQEVAFSLGVISRSLPEVEAGELNVTYDQARAGIEIATLINRVRLTEEPPQTLREMAAVLSVTKHVRHIEDAYRDMIERCPSLVEELAGQYQARLENPFHSREVKLPKRGLLQRLIDFLNHEKIETQLP